MWHIKSPMLTYNCSRGLLLSSLQCNVNQYSAKSHILGVHWKVFFCYPLVPVCSAYTFTWIKYMVQMYHILQYDVQTLKGAMPLSCSARKLSYSATPMITLSTHWHTSATTYQMHMHKVDIKPCAWCKFMVRHWFKKSRSIHQSQNRLISPNKSID